MNKARLLTVSRKNLNEITQALKACDLLLEKTKRFESTIQIHKTITGYLRVLYTAYASRPGKLFPGHKLTPYSVKELQALRGEAVLLSAFAIQNKSREDQKPLEWKSQILEVIDLAIARTQWLEGES